MGMVASIVSAVLKSVVGDKLGSGLVKEITDISIDGISEKSINEITDFINKRKSKIDSILSRENMKSMGISEDKIDYVKTEIKDLFSKINITDEVLRQCKYNNMILKDFMWEEYVTFKNKPSHIECESEIKTCLFAIIEVLSKAMRESEDFSNKMLIQISNTVDYTNVELQNIFDYMKENSDKVEENSQIVLNILLAILEQIQKMNMQDNETKNIKNEGEKFNNKKQRYIENWNSRLFLHMDDDKNPITLADAFIVPRFDYYIKVESIKFSESDSLTEAIDKFIQYDKTSNLLITGSPGIGKTSIISWIADKYKDDENVIILRFRDWSNNDLAEGLLNAIYKLLGCERVDIENKVLIIDGFDEIKSVNERKSLIREFFNYTLDFDNLKVIITSRPNYLNAYDFQNVFKILPFNISQIQEFFQIVKGSKLDKRKIDCENLDVLGIPVILYMAIMTFSDLTLKTTKPELYNIIFAEKGGIFDRFCFKGIGYDGGNHTLTDNNNVKIYLNFLRQAAFSMFEKNDLTLTKDEYQIPKLKFQRQKLKVVEFPIKPFFESDGYNIEFIHKSIYEYFVAEYIFKEISDVIDKSAAEISGAFGSLLKLSILSNEILEYLKFKISNVFTDKFDCVYSSFQLMLEDGMTYYTNECYKNVIECEIKVFINMLEIVNLWEISKPNVNKNNIRQYIRYCYSKFKLSRFDLTKINLSGMRLEEGKFREANLQEANFWKADLKNIDFKDANLYNANFGEANLKMVDFGDADLREVNFIKAKFMVVNLEGADLRGAVFDEKQISKGYIRGVRNQKYDLTETKVYISGTEIITYSEFENRQ